jgi:outer membrane protein TolC
MDPIDPEQVRDYNIQKMNVEASELKKKIVYSEQTPQLDLIARLSYRGADEKASEAFSDLGGLNSPTYYLGLSFQTYLGSSSKQGAKQQAQAELNLEQIRLQKSKMQIRDFINETQRQVNAYYKIALSSEKAVALRKKALKEIEAAYGQGRLDVSKVIDAFNFLLNAETQLTTSIGNYHLWRNQLASLRDELIQQYTASTPKEGSQ